MDINQQLAECKTLLCGISRKLDAVIFLLEQLVNLHREETVSGSYTVTITEDQWRQWWRQAGQEKDGDP